MKTAREKCSIQPIVNAPSLLNCDFMRLPDDVAELIKAGIHFFHIDIIDGHYVQNLAFSVNFVSDLKRAYPDCTADVHLMVTDPENYLPKLADAGADYVSFHADSTRFARRMIDQIHGLGMKAGVAINPSQPIKILAPYFRFLDLAVLMSVEPGFAGQKFLEGSLERLEELDVLRSKAENHFQIEIDGGIDFNTAEACAVRGADILVTGKFVTFQQPDGISSAVRRFSDAMSKISKPEVSPGKRME